MTCRIDRGHTALTPAEPTPGRNRADTGPTPGRHRDDTGPTVAALASSTHGGNETPTAHVAADMTDTQNAAPSSAAADAAGRPIKVDIWSDIACPWCFIGKRKFEDAVGRFDGAVEVEYHSFELSPDTPVDFEGDEVDFLSKHKGMPADQVQGMLAQVAGIASDVGLAYDFDHLQHTNTVKAHQLLHVAKAAGLQAEMKERLLRAYFEEGRHVGRVDDLVALATEVGLEPHTTRAALDDDVYLADVRADQAQAQSFGITGVPFFVLEGKYGISGAQAPEAFLQALEQVASERS